MGRVVCDLVQSSSDCEIVAGVDIFPSQSARYFPTYTDINDCDKVADVIIDFSVAHAVSNVIRYAVRTKIPLVLCTTGLTPDTLNLVNDASRETAILRSANMSVGINLLAELIDKIVSVLGDSNFDIEIIEKHHNQKIDAPSGTAILLADAVKNCSARNNTDKYEYVYDRSKKRERRGTGEIGIHAIRGGTIVGEHTVIFAGRDEVIEITHKAASKEIFAVGALKAARFLSGKPAGLYSMNDAVSNS